MVTGAYGAEIGGTTVGELIRGQQQRVHNRRCVLNDSAIGVLLLTSTPR